MKRGTTGSAGLGSRRKKGVEKGSTVAKSLRGGGATGGGRRIGLRGGKMAGGAERDFRTLSPFDVDLRGVEKREAGQACTAGAVTKRGIHH